MPTDLLLPEIVSPLVKGTIFSGNIRHFFRVGSTNAAAMEAAEAGAPEGTACFAEEQTAGRGRGGHAWHSEPSTGIYLSTVLRPPLSSAEVLVLSLMTGLAVAAAVEEVTGVRCDLRWPNDLLIGARKFCGILSDVRTESGRVVFAVVGIGINVNQDIFPPELEAIATSLCRETGRSWSRVELAAALLQSLDREYRELLRGFDKQEAVAGSSGGQSHTIYQRFEQRSSYARDRHVRVDEGGGYTGITAGLDEHGFLRIRTAEGMRTVISGGVRAID